MEQATQCSLKTVAWCKFSPLFWIWQISIYCYSCCS